MKYQECQICGVKYPDEIIYGSKTLLGEKIKLCANCYFGLREAEYRAVTESMQFYEKRLKRGYEDYKSNRAYVLGK